MTDNVTAATTDHLAGDIPTPDGPAPNGTDTAPVGAAPVSDTAALDAIAGKHDADQSVVQVPTTADGAEAGGTAAEDTPADDAAAEEGPAEEGPADSSAADNSAAGEAAAGAESDAADDADNEAADDRTAPSRPSRRAPAHEQLVAEGDAAGDYLERLLDILDYDGDIDLDVEGERAVVSIIGEGDDVGNLVGDRGEVLDALQELTRLAATAETGQRSRLMLDVAGYRARRRTELSEMGARTAREVLDSGEAARLAPMNPFERKVVHDAVATVEGVSSSSEGEEPRRRVVVSPSA